MSSAPPFLNIFDLDHTLLTINSSFSFALTLKRKRFFELPPQVLCAWYFLRYKYFGLPLQQLHEYAFQSLFKGRRLSDLERRAEEFLNTDLWGFINEPALLRLRMAQELKQHTVIMSSSPIFLVEPIAKKLGVDTFYGSTYTTDEQGYLTGIKQIVDGPLKARLMKDLQAEHEISPSLTCAYSDSYLDLPLLEGAGKAVGVSPDRHLKKVCQKNGWEII